MESLGGSRPLLVKYSPSLDVVKQTSYTGNYIGYPAEHMSFSRFEGTEKYLFGTGRRDSNQSWKAGYGVVDATTHDPVVHCSYLIGGLWAVRIQKIHTMFDENNTPSGAVAFGSFGTSAGAGLGFATMFSKDFEPIASKEVSVAGKKAYLLEGLVTRDKIFGLGMVVGILATGVATLVLVEFDSELEAKQTIGFEAEGSAITCHYYKTQNGYLVATGIVNPTTKKTDAVLFELDENYAVLQQVRLIGDGNDIPTSLSVDKKGNILLCGTTTSSQARGTDVMVVKLDKNFKIIKQITFGGPGAENMPYGVFDKNGAAVVVGGITGTGGALDAYITKLTGDWTTLGGALMHEKDVTMNVNPQFEIETIDSIKPVPVTTMTINDREFAPQNGSMAADHSTNLVK